MNSKWLAQRNTHPALLCCRPVGGGLAAQQLATKNVLFGPAHLSRCGPVDSGLWAEPPRDIACADCTAARGHLNSP